MESLLRNGTKHFEKSFDLSKYEPEEIFCNFAETYRKEGDMTIESMQKYKDHGFDHSKPFWEEKHSLILSLFIKDDGRTICIAVTAEDVHLDSIDSVDDYLSNGNYLTLTYYEKFGTDWKVQSHGEIDKKFDSINLSNLDMIKSIFRNRAYIHFSGSGGSMTVTDFCHNFKHWE